MNAKPEAPRILVVENNRRVRESYEVLLRYWGYLPVLAVGEGKFILKDGITKAKAKRCILALIDLHLIDDFDEEDMSGLKLSTEIGPIRSIILSGNPNQDFLRELMDQHKDTRFINKADAREKIKQILDSEMSKVCAHQRGLQISPPALLTEIAQTTLRSLIGGYPDQIADILAQLFPAATSLRIEKLDSNILFSQASTVPRPHSVVLRVYEEDYEPVLVKLARAKKIQGEVDRYEKFISRKVGGYFTARLEKHACLWDLGGARYTYIGDFDVTTFSRYYEEHSIQDIEECLTEFFTVAWGKHYERKEAQTNLSLFDLYKETWGNWYEKDVKNFPCQNPWQSGDVAEQLALPNPIEWFKIYIAENPDNDLSFVETTQKAVTHGDLHGDNLLIDNRKNAWVIDFERSGEGHALQDFIELEADIINRLHSHSEDLASYYEMCMRVAQQTEVRELGRDELRSRDPKIEKALNTISVLRRLACRCTEITDARQYLMGLLFNTLFRATMKNGDKNGARQNGALTLAGIFCHRLEHWDEPWPPEQWKTILQYD